MLSRRLQLAFGGSVLIAMASTLAPAWAGVGDGPRIYQPAPVGTTLLSFSYMYENTAFNIDGSPSQPATRIKAHIMAAQFTKVIDFGGRTAGVFAALPVAKVNGSLIGTARSGDSSGFADAQVGAVFSLVGAPAMTKQEYRTAKSGFNLGGLVRLSAPTGEYSASKTVNVGSNVWGLNLGAPMTWNLRNSYVPGQLSTLELTPGVWFYGDNTNPTGGANRQSRDPLYYLEAHLTHDFSSKFWGSLDALYVTGGSTVTDGSRDNNATNTGGLGVTTGFNIGNGFGLQVSYGQSIKSNTDGLNDHLVRIKLSTSF